MARTGATFAKVLLYNGDEPSVFASYLIRIIFKEKIENALYWYFTKTKYYWEQANSLQSGAAQPHFNGAAVKQVIFSYPKSIKEQKFLIQKFETLSVETKRLESIYQQKIQDLDELKKSVLQKAFNGELKTETSLR
jgi:type I restriction enzyme S subunit